MSRRRLRQLGAVVVLAAVLIGLLATRLFRGFDPAELLGRRLSPAGLGPPNDLALDAFGSGHHARGDWWEIAFTAPRYPDRPADHHGGLDERLVSLIDESSSTVDVAIYDFDLRNVADALARAARRGVRVRMVTDTDTLRNTHDPEVQTAFATVRAAGVPVVDDRRSDLMHNKFSVFDGETVETGSWNYTIGDTYRLNNDQFIGRSAELASIYTNEFEKMYVQRQFGPAKRGAARAPLNIGPSRVEVRFSPRDEIGTRLVSLVTRQAERSIDFLAFSFTLDPLGQAILDRSRSGVSVRGVFETTGSQTQYSELGRLKAAGLDVYQDGNPWSMHHKVLIIDDRIVAFGSFNFSTSADDANDENILIVEDQSLARAFQVESNYILAVARSAQATGH